MSKMGTLHLLVQEASRSEEAKYKELLEDFLEKQCNFGLRIIKIEKLIFI